MDLSSNFKGIKNISTIGISNLVGSIISAFFWIYLASLLGSENYGELTYYISIAGIVTSISLVGGPMAITVLVAKKIKIQSTIYALSISGSIISAIVLYFAFTNIGVSIFVLGAVIYNLASSELLGRKFYKKYSIYFILQKILFVLFALIFYYIIGPEGVLLGIGLSFFIFIDRIYDGFKNTKFNLQLLKNKWAFIRNNFFVDLSQILNGQIDKIIIGPVFGFSILGNYYLAVQVLYLLAILPEAVKQYILPEDSSGEDTTKIKILTIIFSMGLALIGIFIAPQLLLTLFPEYTDLLDLVPIISISIIPTTVYTLCVSKFLVNEKSGYIVITSIISVGVLISGIFILGEIFGTVGLAYSLVIFDCTRAFVLFILSRKI